MVAADTPIRLRKSTIERLKIYKDHESETYDALLNKLINDPGHISRVNARLEEYQKIQKQREIGKKWQKYSEVMADYVAECERILNTQKDLRGQRLLNFPEMPKIPFTGSEVPPKLVKIPLPLKKKSKRRSISS